MPWKRALFSVTVAGTNITPLLEPVMTRLTVNNKVGTHTDSATLEVDDTDGRIVFPDIGAECLISLGWVGQGMRLVFEGTVDDVRSKGSRSGGRAISINAKGVDTTGRAKEGQQRHWDDTTVGQILTDAAAYAGIDGLMIDPILAALPRTYFEARDESFIALGERLAREVGGNFRITGNRLIFSLRNGMYDGLVTARWTNNPDTSNLHDWDIAPALGRPQFNVVRARWYDMAAHAWQLIDMGTSLGTAALQPHRFSKFNDVESGQQNFSDGATTERDAGEGKITIEGNTDAIPDGLCLLEGTRSGVDGFYRIESVQHTLDRGSGFKTGCDLKQPIT